MRTQQGKRRETRGRSGPRWSRAQKSAVAGLAGAAALTAASAVLHTVWTAVPFVPVAIAQHLVRVTSGAVNSFFIGRLGYWAERLALLGTCVAFVLAGIPAGLIVNALGRPGSPRRSRLWWASLLPLWALSVALYVEYPELLVRRSFALVTLPLHVAAGGLAGWMYVRLVAPAKPVPTDLGRRYLLRSVTLGGLGVVLGVANLGRLIYRRPDPGTQRLVLAHVTGVKRRVLAPGDAAFAHIPGLTPEITSIVQHYVVDEELIDPDIDPATWRLSVGGLVGRPFRLTYDALKALAAVERYQTLECISNKVGGHLMSTAKWTGVPLPGILDRAGVRPGAVEVVFRSAGGYSDSLSIEQAMDPSTLIAIGMNGHVLPRAHGFPARLLSVGTYGMKNPKWLESIEVVDRPYQGFWEQRGWVKPAIVKTESRIDTPIDGAEVAAPVTIAGVAIAGDRGISGVEVSTDGGNTWNQARLKTVLGPYTWRQWLYRWTPQTRGTYPLLVRAYDGRGAVQSAEALGTFPSGAQGYERISVAY